MLILTIRTDKPEAEIGLFDDHRQLQYETWMAHRELSDTIHLKIRAMLEAHQKTPQDLEGIVAYQGPGSFTGLRIGLTVANALADSLNLPIIATADDDWIEAGITSLLSGENQQIVMPEYGQAPNITKPKH